MHGNAWQAEIVLPRYRHKFGATEATPLGATQRRNETKRNYFS